MPFWAWFLVGTGIGILLIALVAYLLLRRYRRREPYASFEQLPLRGKLKFLWWLFRDPRVPAHVRLAPLLLMFYVLWPLDLIPEFIPVLGALDDLVVIAGTLALVIRAAPSGVVEELLQRARDEAAAD